jgi:peptidyl-prolyl cis-trans isomerase SurA
MNRLFACLLAVAAVFSTAQATAQQLQPVDRIVAVVDEDVILRSELDRALQNVLSQYATRQDQLPPRDVLEKQVLERLILVRLQVARATSSGINVSDQEVDGAIANVARQNNVAPDQLGEQLARDGMTIADLRSSIRDEIAIQRLRQSFAQSRISVSEGEVDAALAGMASGNQYHLAHILVGLPEGATPDQIAAAQKKIDGIKGQVERGEIDFAAAAVRYSDSPNALEGGDLGWRSLGEIPPTFAQAITTMQAGQVIGPVRGPSGFQLLQLVGTRDASAAGAGTVTQLQARHILVRTGEGGVADDAAAQAKLETLRARIAGGADFAALAKENSADTATAGKGGELGWFAQDAYGADFGAQVAALQDGQVSAPFKTEAGWHIVQREGARQVAAADENRRQQVREGIGQRKLEEEWDRYLRELRGESYVEIRLAGDTAAPATETAPPATAPAPADGG